MCCSPGVANSQLASNRTTIYTLKSLISQTTYYSKIISTRKSVLRTLDDHPAKCDDLKLSITIILFTKYCGLSSAAKPHDTYALLISFKFIASRKALTKLLESKSKVKNILICRIKQISIFFIPVRLLRAYAILCHDL